MAATRTDGPFSRRRLANAITRLENLLHNTSAPAKVFYVSSTATNASNSNTGLSPLVPLATLAGAISKCTAGVGDAIELLPFHAETVNAAAFAALSKTGIQVFGRGNGSARPTFTWATDTAATITVTAAGCRLSNIIFDMSLPSALVSGIVISAAGCKIDNCLFKIGTAGAGTRPLQAILTTAAADYLEISDCDFTEPSATPTTVSASSCAIKLVGGTGIRILRNRFTGWYTTTVGAITGITTLTDNIRITDNYIVNQTGSATKGIVLLTGSTGLIMNNGFGIASGAVPITADAAWWCRNWSAAAVATNGTLV